MRNTGTRSKSGERRIDFRRKALERLSAPEQLDRMLSVTPAREWIALLTVLAVAIAVGVWSVVGEVATYVEADGFLLHRGGRVVDAAPAGGGRLSAIYVAVGDEIEQGAVVAQITDEQLAARYDSVLAYVEERSQALEALKADIADESGVVLANNARRREQLGQLEAIAVEMLGVARANFENNERLFEERMVSRLDLESSQQEFNEARRVLLSLGRDRDALEANEIKFQIDNESRIRDMTDQVDAATRQARELEALVDAEKVLAPISGQVIEVKVTTGAIVLPGEAVASIRTGTTVLEVLFYVPPDEGKMVETGMEALVTPATVRREEFGSVRGTVTSLSPFPASFEGMVAVLQNTNLALAFSEEGPPYSGRIDLIPDTATVSGFAWTSPKGADQGLSAGTLALVEIKTRSQAPITLAVPLLREWLGIR